MFECTKTCDCICPKKSSESDLKKCQESSKKKTNEIHLLKRKLMIATIAIAVGGTLMGKEALDRVVAYFQAYDKVKQSIDSISLETGDKYEIPFQNYYGVSPSPSTLAIFALPLLIPKQRRR
tara:strand:+ start:457 stop:822 length:366 start_codon:yes stop_codon:yes gene_type:complete